MVAAKAAAKNPEKRSGIRKFKPGDVLFNENDSATSLFIIQKGQIRLYRPKGKGFVELAILRSGEVIGEMAYFDEKSRRRSCSAAAIVTTEVIEISFKAFEKTMSGLNPWFKTIINTLADRLRKTNERVKSLETNSVGFGAGGKVGSYVFFHNTDIIRLLAILYLVLKDHGEENDVVVSIHLNKLKFYLFDVFGIPELKWEEFLLLLRTERFVDLANDEDGFPKILKVPYLDGFRSMVVFLNTQRILTDDKKLNISAKCEKFLKKVIEQLSAKGEIKDKMTADISSILGKDEDGKSSFTEEDLRDAIVAGLCEDIFVGEGNKLTSVVHFTKLKKIYPCIKIMNAIAKINESKAGKGH